MKFNYGHGPSFYTDSCLSGYGLWVDNDWQASYFDSNFSPDLSGLCEMHEHWLNFHLEEGAGGNINILELIPVWLAAKRKAGCWKNSDVICCTDNASVKFMINKGCSSKCQQ